MRHHTCLLAPNECFFNIYFTRFNFTHRLYHKIKTKTAQDSYHRSQIQHKSRSFYLSHRVLYRRASKQQSISTVKAQKHLPASTARNKSISKSLMLLLVPLKMILMMTYTKHWWLQLTVENCPTIRIHNHQQQTNKLYCISTA